MKTLFSYIVILFTAFASMFFCNEAKAQKMTGSKNITSEQRAISNDYQSLKVSQGIKVTLTTSQDAKAFITANDNIMPYVKVENSGSELKVYLDNSKYKSFNNIKVTVQLPQNPKLNYIDSSSAGKVAVHHPLNASKITAKASSAAHIEFFGNIEAKTLFINSSSAAEVRILESNVDAIDASATSAAKIELKAKAESIKADASSAANIDIYTLCTHLVAKGASSADIELSGKAKNLSIDVSSAADADADELETSGEAVLSASSGAEISAWCNGTLKATATSGADIDWKGKAIAEVKKSSGGSVSRN